jgi:hypothetical protein
MGSLYAARIPNPIAPTTKTDPPRINHFVADTLDVTLPRHSRY